MMKTLLYGSLAFLAAFYSIAPSAGQNQLPPTDIDQIGIYAEPDFDGPNAVFTEGAVGDEITAYIVLTGLTAGSVGGFECEIDFAGDSEMILASFPVEAIDVTPDPAKFAVGFMTPVPAVDGIAMVSTIVFRMLSSPEWLFVGPLTPGDLPTEMIYLDGDDGVTIITFYPSSGDVDLPVFAVNSDDVVPTVSTTWTSLKTLFR